MTPEEFKKMYNFIRDNKEEIFKNYVHKDEIDTTVYETPTHASLTEALNHLMGFDLPADADQRTVTIFEEHIREIGARYGIRV